MNALGMALIFFGITIAVIGLALVIMPGLPFLGKLPGDFSFQAGNVKIFFPLATCLLLSLILSIIVNVLTGHK